MMIRYAEESDLEFLEKGLLGVRTIEKRPAGDLPVSEEDTESFLKGIEQKEIRVIDDEKGKPAAFMYHRTDFPIPYVHGDFLWIDILYVREDCRGRGMGTALYRDALRIAGEKGLDRVVIDVFDANERSKKFHRDLDFKPFYTIYIKEL
jgi:L-amino acid N-acyltransferase YncA